MSFFTFRKYLKAEKIYKKPHRMTDLCNLCEWAKNIKINIKKDLKNKSIELDYLNFDKKDVFKLYENMINEYKAKLAELNNDINQNDSKTNIKKEIKKLANVLKFIFYILIYFQLVLKRFKDNLKKSS